MANLGTEEKRRQKISDGLKKAYLEGRHRVIRQFGNKHALGNTAWNKGIPNPSICGENNPAKRPSIGKKISEAKMGHIVSKETREKLSKSLCGCTAWNKGKKHPKISGAKNCNWKGGVTPEYEQIRKSIETKLWRKSVFGRDNFTCQMCNSDIGGKLHSHHIFNFSDYVGKRFDVTNGITLCKDCHDKFHKNYGYKNNNDEQLNNFLGGQNV